MAWALGTDLKGLRTADQNCGGLRRMLVQGTGTISGTTKQGAGAGAVAPCRVYLMTCDGVLVGFRRTDTSGTYSFLGLAPGRYMLLVQDDQQDNWRPKVELIVVP